MKNVQIFSKVATQDSSLVPSRLRPRGDAVLAHVDLRERLVVAHSEEVHQLEALLGQARLVHLGRLETWKM